MSAFDELASRYQSRRVARDVLDFGRQVSAEHWWWWDPILDLEHRGLAVASQQRLSPRMEEKLVSLAAQRGWQTK